MAPAAVVARALVRVVGGGARAGPALGGWVGKGVAGLAARPDLVELIARNLPEGPQLDALTGLAGVVKLLASFIS